MDYLHVFTLVFSLFYVIRTEAAVPNESILQQIAWQETVEDVNKTNTLAQVLREYLGYIETVEAAASNCSSSHREQHQRGETALQRVMEHCVGKSDTRRQTLVTCVEDKTGRLVSDVRQFINTLKNCLDA